MGMSDSSRAPDRANDFRVMYENVYPDLLRFVQRRSHVGSAEDVVADAFLVVWRRCDEAPADHGDARAWIFGIARNVLLNTERGEQRRLALGVRLADATTEEAVSSHDDLTIDRIDLSRAWQLLPEAYQEALALSVFEDLSAPHAAAVLGISPVAFRLRLSRARRSLRSLLEQLPHPARPTATSSERTTTP
jgi:RNA polymerase sigma-70 factor (ECF subfamily)